MKVHHRIFESSTQSWEVLAEEAQEFATSVGPERLINISLAASGGTEWLGSGGNGVLIVWYWK